MPTPVFFDTEFSSLRDPHVWSVRLVTLDGRECYAELSVESDIGRVRLANTPLDVREGVRDKLGLIPDAVCTSEPELGRRVGQWLLGVAVSARSGRIALMYGYHVDLKLLAGALQGCDLWPQLHGIAVERDIGAETGSIGPELASEAALAALQRRAPPLYRHHALADALALRAARRTWQLVHERGADFVQVIGVVGDEQEGWLYGWLASRAMALGGQVPLHVLHQAGGLQLEVDVLGRIEGGCA